MTFLFFAQCAEWAGVRTKNISAEGPARLSRLVETSPELSFLKGRLGFLKVAVNKKLSSWDEEVRHGDEIAVMPPFSGG